MNVQSRLYRVAIIVAVSIGMAAPAASAWSWSLPHVTHTVVTRTPAKDVSVFKVGGLVAETRDPWDVFGFDERVVFSDLIDAIDEAAASKRVGTLLFKLRSNTLGLAQLEELASAMQRARGAGKKVVVHLLDGQNAQMLAATAADEVHLTPEGSVTLVGLQAEVAFYKDLLDTVGLEADIESVGEYKSAAEPMLRRDMSDAAREAMDAVLDSLYASLVERLGSNRGLKPDEVKAIMDVGLLTAEDAKKRKLVDELTSWTSLLRRYEKQTGKAPQLAFPKAEPLPDFSSFLGLLDLLTRTPDDKRREGERVALLVAEGPIMTGATPTSMFSNDPVIASDSFVKTLQAIEEDSTIKAIVLRIDSPGGSALASDVIWRELRRVGKKRPIVVSMGNVAASGGYYIASAARRIVAEPTTITGSIGVFGGKMVWKGLFDKVGINSVVLSRGRHAGLYSSLTRFSNSEREVLRASMQHTYDTFVNRVMKGRRMGYDAVHKVARGRVWTGQQAKEIGLVDQLGGIHDAVTEAAKYAGLDPAKAQVVTFPERKSLMQLMTEDRHTLKAPSFDLKAVLGQLPLPLAAKIGKLATTLQHLLSGEQAIVMLPFALEIR